MNEPVVSRAIFDSLALLRPYDINRRKARFGSKGDGGYIYADQIDPSQPVLSFGVSGNCDLEWDLAERGHRIVMFDPSVEGPPKQHANFEFHKIGVARQNNPAGDYVSLSKALDIAGFKGRTDVILKMDVEGAEFPSFAGAEQELLLHFDQIALEIHWLNNLFDATYRANFDDCFSKINKYFTLFHVHGNNCTPLANVGGVKFNNGHVVGGAIVPQVLELSYIRSSKVTASSSRTLYPTRLDRPNHSRYPDHLLAFFPFMPCDDETFERMGLLAQANDVSFVR